MDINKVILELKEFCPVNKKSNDTLVIKSFQINLLDGYFGTVINQIKTEDKYEVYSYLKNKYDIVCPLLLKTFNDEENAFEYFNKILDISKKSNVDDIINLCKKGIKK